jgi:nucleoside-diphosphate-sugar epimerase
MVTGGTGFTGEHVVRLLVGRGIAPTLLVRPGSDRSRFIGLPVRFVEGDLCDTIGLRKCFAHHDYLLNVASIGFGHGPDIVRCAVDAGVTRAVFTSTTAILTQLSVRTKPVRAAAETAVRDSKLQWTIVRPTMIYGTARDRNVCQLLRCLKRWRLMPLPGGGHAMQQPIHVDDVADALVRCLLSDTTIHGVYNISGLLPLSFRDMVMEAARAVGVRPLLLPIPVTPIATMAGLLEGIGLPTRIRAEQLRRINEDKAFSHDAASKDFGFSPRSFAVGVRQQARAMGLA